MGDILFPISYIESEVCGNGLWEYHPMCYVVFSGCNMKCGFCDMKHLIPTQHMTVEQVLEEVGNNGLTHVVLTGGEPLIHPAIGRLTSKLLDDDRVVHIETNGTTGIVVKPDWLTVSPKSIMLNFVSLSTADEIMFMVGELDPIMEHFYGGYGMPAWEKYIESVLNTITELPNLYVVPINKEGYDTVNMEAAREYCERNPMFNVSLRAIQYPTPLKAHAVC
jgi:7-carboxy-7-deazaguanine synthase